MNSNLPTTMRAAGEAGVPAQLAAHTELVKPALVWLILMSTAMGCYLAADGALPAVQTLHALCATALLAAGTGALNQWWERDVDARMRRTAMRPLPAGRVPSRAALIYASGLTVAGLAYLLAGVNALSFWLGVCTVVSYNLVYTPLKTRTWWSTTLGAFPGAVPPLMGWAALRGSLGVEAWVLFGILFLWQFPHFYAIAWMYREDYARAGIRMLPVVEPSGRSTYRQIIVSSALLVPLSMAPAWLGMAASWYAVPAFVLGCAYLAAGVRLAKSGTAGDARDLLRASVLYLPVLYLFLLVAKP
ncbi:MAG: heme o synthase [Bryobacterales bacterium]|nr:heme o synthase [Bryobacterales bacterium]